MDNANIEHWLSDTWLGCCWSWITPLYTDIHHWDHGKQHRGLMLSLLPPHYIESFRVQMGSIIQIHTPRWCDNLLTSKVVKWSEIDTPYLLSYRMKVELEFNMKGSSPCLESYYFFSQNNTWHLIASSFISGFQHFPWKFSFRGKLFSAIDDFILYLLLLSAWLPIIAHRLKPKTSFLIGQSIKALGTFIMATFFYLNQVNPEYYQNFKKLGTNGCLYHWVLD